MSHNLQDGKTRGILNGLTDAGLRNLRDHLSPAGKEGWYEHPLDLPTILLKIYSRHTQWEINRLADDVASFEEAAKQEKYKEIDQFDDITTQLAFLEPHAVATEQLCSISRTRSSRTRWKPDLRTIPRLFRGRIRKYRRSSPT